MIHHTQICRHTPRLFHIQNVPSRSFLGRSTRETLNSGSLLWSISNGVPVRSIPLPTVLGEGLIVAFIPDQPTDLKEKKTKFNNSGKYRGLLQIAHYGKAGSMKNVWVSNHANLTQMIIISRIFKHRNTWCYSGRLHLLSILPASITKFQVKLLILMMKALRFMLTDFLPGRARKAI